MQSRTRGGPTQAASIMLALLVVLTAVFQTPVYAQVETGQIAGTVADPQGAVIAGATIVVQSKGTGATRTQKSMGDGSYIFSNLQPGDYEVRVEGSGFGAKTVPVRVTVGTKTTVDVALDVTGTGEVVDVVAGDQGVQVNTENQVLSTVVSEKQIRELPTITRNPYALVQLAGTAVAVDPEAQDPNTTTSDRGAGFNINGQRSSSTNVMLDGADNNDTYGSDIGNAVPLDSVQEFTVLTNNFSAEYGRAGGGVVNVATKAGTNEFHGTIYEFNRISALATDSANLKGQFVPSKKGVFTRNQFGYSVGGPVVKDKLQFFQSTEWLRVRSQDTSIALVPTAELISQTPANVQAFFAPFALGPSSPGRVFTVGEIGGTPGGPFSQLPSNLPAFQEVFYTIPADAGGGFPQDQYQIVGRADWNISDRTTMYGRYAYQNITFAEGALSFSPYQGFNSPSITKNHNFLVSATHVWSDNFVSQSKFAFSRVANDQPLGEQPATPSLYLQQNVKSTLLGRDVGLPGYYPFSPSAAIPAGGPANMFQVYQDQTWTIGSHAIRFGGSFIRIHDDHFFGAFESAVQELGGSSFAGLDNLLRGQTARFRVAIDPKGSFPGDTVQFPVSAPQFLRNNRYNEGALYINDSWKIHPRVTLNLGLRWDYFGVQHSADPSLDSNFHLGSGSTIFEQIRNGEVFLSADNPAGGLWGKDNDNFGPRIGIAWDVFGDGKTSLRGGYGLSFERNFGNVTFNVIQNPPAYAVLDLINTVPISIDNLGPAAGAGGSFTLPRTSLRYVDENIKTAYAHFWSASLEHEFANGLVGSLEYSGSKGVDLYSLEDLNGPFSAIHYGLPLSPGSNGRLNEQYSSINAPQRRLLELQLADGGRAVARVPVDGPAVPCEVHVVARDRQPVVDVQRRFEPVQPRLDRSVQSRDRQGQCRLRRPSPVHLERYLGSSVREEHRRLAEAPARRLAAELHRQRAHWRPVHDLRLHERLPALQPPAAGGPDRHRRPGHDRAAEHAGQPVHVHRPDEPAVAGRCVRRSVDGRGGLRSVSVEHDGAQQLPSPGLLESRRWSLQEHRVVGALFDPAARRVLQRVQSRESVHQRRPDRHLRVALHHGVQGRPASGAARDQVHLLTIASGRHLGGGRPVRSQPGCGEKASAGSFPRRPSHGRVDRITGLSGFIL
ncbi:MAG: TonB-dependent receptor [Blastocatellia bacterium]|nr:TonB-dependent receptor [Blastocatellia bacterium]